MYICSCMIVSLMTSSSRYEHISLASGVTTEFGYYITQMSACTHSLVRYFVWSICVSCNLVIFVCKLLPKHYCTVCTDSVCFVYAYLCFSSCYMYSYSIWNTVVTFMLCDWVPCEVTCLYFCVFCCFFWGGTTLLTIFMHYLCVLFLSQTCHRSDKKAETKHG